jgi:hypothetical protein
VARAPAVDVGVPGLTIAAPAAPVVLVGGRDISASAAGAARPGFGVHGQLASPLWLKVLSWTDARYHSQHAKLLWDVRFVGP